MLAWMLYVITVTLLLSAGAYVAERAIRLNRGGTRWIWAGAIAAALCIPVVAEGLHSRLAAGAGQPAAQESTVISQGIAHSVSPSTWIAAAAAAETPAWTRELDVLLPGLLRGVSALMLLLLLGSGLHLGLRMRRWRPATVAGVPVLVSQNAGPAVVGFIKPRVVVPRWVLLAPRHQQVALLAHEQSHLDAGDARLFTLALALLVLVPWNLPLWWQLQRLRRAIEIDCDARVLRSGIDAASYGETLISVGERRSAHFAALAATPGSRSFLEQRLRIMMSKPGKWRRTATVALSFLSLGLTAFGAQVSPPITAEASAARPAPQPAAANPNSGGSFAIKLPAATLDRYVGDYAQGDRIFYKVGRDGDHLVADSSAGPRLELLAEGEDHFFVMGRDVKVIFANDGSGKAPSAVLRQMGRDLPISRVDAAAVAQFEANLKARLQSQAPAPGTEAALRHLLASLDAGTPDYASMQPLLAEAVRRDLPMFMAQGKQLGPIESVRFAGVDGGGWDTYEVQRTHAQSRDRIILASDGTIAGYFTTQP